MKKPIKQGAAGKNATGKNVAAQNGTSNRPQVRFVTVTEQNAGQRVDNFLLAQIKGVPRAYVYRILRKGEVRINKKRAKPTVKLALGDEVRIPPVFIDEKPQQAAPEHLLKRLNDAILLEDDDLIFINKPSGLAVHGGTGQAYGLIESFRQLRPNLPFVELVHRLDKETSGIVMLAKNRPALLELHDLLKTKAINKHYQTLVRGHWTGGRQKITSNLQRQQGKHAQKIKVVEVSEHSKRAESIFTPITHFSPQKKHYTLLEVEILTGRMHQIRTQLADKQHPILGDSQYGDFAENREAKKQLKLKRLFLHAFHLHFVLPSSGKHYDCNIPLAEDLQAVVSRLDSPLESN